VKRDASPLFFDWTALQLIHPLVYQGDAEAQHNLGVRYQNGPGVPQDSTAH
jgi:hypothetical protein